MSGDEAFHDLIETYLSGTLTPTARAELLASIETDPDRKKEFIEQVRMSHVLGSMLQRRSPEQLWSSLEAVLDGGEDVRVRRLIAVIDAEMDAPGVSALASSAPATPQANRSRRRWVVAAGLAATACVALMATTLLRRGSSQTGTMLVQTNPRTVTTVLTETNKIEAKATPKERADIVPPLLEGGDTVFAPDLSSGVRPKVLELGNVAPCPPRAGVHYCFTGSRAGRWPSEVVVQLHGGDGGAPLFPYSDDLLLSFDYWLGEGLGPNKTQLTGFFSVGQGPGDFEITLPQTERGRWVHTIFPLAGYVHRGANPKPGTGVVRFNVSGKYLAEDVLFVANLKVAHGIAPR